MIQNKYSLGIFLCAPDSLSANPHQSFQSWHIFSRDVCASKSCGLI